MKLHGLSLPNVRDLFIPDPGYIWGCADLDRADAQVVAWEADAQGLKQIFREGRDLHEENARTIFGTCTPERRDLAKMACHAMNYGVKERTMAQGLGITIHEAGRVRKVWFGAHPEIEDWHKRVEAQLHSTRSVANKFGNRIIFFDRVDGLLPQALAWVPQSTVAQVINKGWQNLDKNLPEVWVLIQAHDELIMQWPLAHDPAIRPVIREHLTITIPYDEPLIIPVGLKVSTESWGQVKEASW